MPVRRRRRKRKIETAVPLVLVQQNVYMRTGTENTIIILLITVGSGYIYICHVVFITDNAICIRQIL